MAKRKKAHHKPTRRRSRRMSGLGSQGLSEGLMEAAGLVVGSIVATVMQRQLTAVNPKLVSGGQLVGAILMRQHAKTPLMQGVVYGIMSAGSIGLVHEVGIIHGIDNLVSGCGNGGGYERDLDPGDPRDDRRHGMHSGQHHMHQGHHYMHGISNDDRISGFGNNHRISMIEEDMEAEERMRPIG